MGRQKHQEKKVEEEPKLSAIKVVTEAPFLIVIDLEGVDLTAAGIQQNQTFTRCTERPQNKNANNRLSKASGY